MSPREGVNTLYEALNFEAMVEEAQLAEDDMLYVSFHNQVDVCLEELRLAGCKVCNCCSISSFGMGRPQYSA